MRQHIPWTRVVADVSTDALRRTVSTFCAFIRKARENLVLKPSDEYGGTGVTLGWETTRKRMGRHHRKGSRRRKCGW